MKTRCPGCGAVYRLDPTKVPPGGVRARCARCSDVFAIRSSAVSAPDEVRSSAISAPQVAPAPDSIGFGSDASQHPAERADYDVGAARAGDIEPAPFGSRDPDARARRLARALVSDIAVYHGERRERSLREGRLRHELGDEIRKSWQEYESQVGNQIARETSYFRDALNEILARGEKLF